MVILPIVVYEVGSLYQGLHSNPFLNESLSCFIGQLAFKLILPSTETI